MDEQHYEYRTGRTQPREKHNGIIAFLLILVIFLGGLVSALGLLNIHLFRLLNAQKESAPLAFSKDEAVLSDQTTADGIRSMELMGMEIQEVPVLYGQMHDLPAGLYVCLVTSGSDAEALGIIPGDVLTAFAGTPVSQISTLQTLVETHRGTQVELTACRDGLTQRFIITVDGD